MDDLVTWLRQQLDEDERAARAAARPTLCAEWACNSREVFTGNAAVRKVADVAWSEDIAAHIARHDPARVLAEVDAKRRVIDVLRGFEPNDEWATQPDMGLRLNNAAGALRALALPYADRPGYREEWRP